MLGFDPFNIRPKGSDDYNNMSEAFVRRRTQELSNGRLAMLAVAGFVAQELRDDLTVVEHFQQFGLGMTK